jgi:hypothetical protein
MSFFYEDIGHCSPQRPLPSLLSQALKFLPTPNLLPASLPLQIKLSALDFHYFFLPPPCSTPTSLEFRSLIAQKNREPWVEYSYWAIDVRFIELTGS